MTQEGIKLEEIITGAVRETARVSGSRHPKIRHIISYYNEGVSKGTGLRQTCRMGLFPGPGAETRSG